MSKLVSAEELEKMLADAAEGLTPREYTLGLEEVLGDTETSDMAKIASHSRPNCRDYCPGNTYTKLHRGFGEPSKKL